MPRQLPQILQLGDVADVEGYVAAVVKRYWPGIPADEREEKIADGFYIVYKAFHNLAEGESLSRRLALCLRDELIDRWRVSTKRGKTTEAASLDATVGGPNEPWVDRADEVDLRIAVVAIVGSPEDLADPRKAGALRQFLHSPDGRFMGVPSYRPASEGERLEYLRVRTEDDSDFDFK